MINIRVRRILLASVTALAALAAIPLVNPLRAARPEAIPLSPSAKEFIKLGARLNHGYSMNEMENLQLDDKFSGGPDMFARLPELDATRAIDLIGDKTTDGALPYLSKMAGLKAIHLHDVSLAPDQLKQISTLTVSNLFLSVHYRKGDELRPLVLKDAAHIEHLGLDDVVLKSLTVDSMASLQFLRVSAPEQPDDAKFPVTLGNLPALKSLELVNINAVILPLKDFPKLEHFSLYGDASDESLKQLATLKNLQTVKLYAVKNADIGVQALADSHLTSLSVSYGATDESLRKIADWSHLTEFETGNKGVSIAGLEHLSQAKGLTVLVLDDTRVDDSLAKAIAPLHALVSVNLISSPVGDKTVAQLAKQPELDSLDLSRTKITDAALKELAGCKSLRDLDVRETAVTAPAVAALEKASPELRIVSDVNDWLHEKH